MAPRKKPAAKAPAKVPSAATSASTGSAAATKGDGAVVDRRVLPEPQAELFKQALQNYEQKQHRTGLKAVEQILATNPDHGETLAMKGIFLTCLGRKPEGYSLVKRGIANDPGSHIVWHVYALVLRADKNFEEAFKCYKKATQIEPESLSLINDLAMLAVHLRHYEDYAAARLLLLKAQPRFRRNWIYLAVAQHLAGQLWQADRTLTMFEDMIRDVPDREYEYCEILLYHASILEENGELERALEFLSEHTSQIVDRTAFSVQRAHILLKLGRTEAADWAWEVLLEENPDNHEFIRASVLAKGANCDASDADGRALAVVVLDKLADKHPSSLSIKRLTLELVSGQDFRTRAAKYLIDALSKGVPSIFADVKTLYADSEKRAIIGELAEEFRSSLESSSTFSQTASDDSVEGSTVYLWTVYFLAQHYSTIGDHSKALSLVSLAATHTPSLPEIWMLRARILKRAGDDIGAKDSMNEARLLDGQDRFLNSKAAKYMIRIGDVDEAESVLGLFTKKDAPSPFEDLLDMQCLWVIHEEAQSYERQGKFAMALKRYQQLFKTFVDVEEDQYDFHGYCVRKGTLRAYIKMMRYMDRLRSHPRYVAAATRATEIYLTLHDNPEQIRPTLTNGDADAEDDKVEKEVARRRTEEEKRIAEQKSKEKEEREKAEKEKKKLAIKDKSNKKPAEKKPELEEPFEEIVVDEDPWGTKLLKTTEPLEEALKIVKPLQKEAPQEIITWILTFRIAARQSKYLQAVRALRTAKSLAAHSPLIRPAIVQLAVIANSEGFASQDDAVKSTVNEALQDLLENRSIEQYCTSNLQTRGDLPDEILASAETLLASKGPEIERGGIDVPEVGDVLLSLTDDQVDAKLSHLVRAIRLLERTQSAKLDEFVKRAKARFPLARAFMTPDESKAFKVEDGIQADANTAKEPVE
ncbi:hypothetical protein OIV83_002087 [Microbotryomycetes sp. JL201]|nr:hypothetical protein OIV83_002087 [Microbotryomycetes sp. JL201]